MTKKQTKRYQQALEEKLLDVLTERLRLEAVCVDRSSDSIDEAQTHTLVEIAQRTADNETKFVEDVTLALERLKSGEFGVCEVCGDSIAPLRLKALPWASRCIRCQTRVETGALVRAEAA